MTCRTRSSGGRAFRRMTAWICFPVLLAPMARAYGQPAHSEHRLSVVVDGSRTPDLIPDELAYRHFILSIAERRNPSREESRRRDIRLRDIRLSDPDQYLLIAAVQGLREELETIEEARKEALQDMSVTRDATLASLKAREDKAIAAVRSSLRLLSPDGQARLDEHIKTRVKKRIVILGDPQQSAGAVASGRTGP